VCDQAEQEPGKADFALEKGGMTRGLMNGGIAQLLIRKAYETRGTGI